MGYEEGGWEVKKQSTTPMDYGHPTRF